MTAAGASNLSEPDSEPALRPEPESEPAPEPVPESASESAPESGPGSESAPAPGSAPCGPARQARCLSVHSPQGAGASGLETPMSPDIAAAL